MLTPGRFPRADRSAYAFLAPYLALYSVFLLAPVVYGFLLSLHSGGLLEGTRYVGLANYGEVWSNPFFRIALRNTGLYAIIAVPAAMALSLGTALLVHGLARWWQSLVRVALFLPLISSAVALSLVWRALLTPGQTGPLNWLLGLVGLPAQNWLGHPDWVIPAIAAFQVWSGYGFWVIVFLAGLDAIPQELYEAARVDGAGRWQLFARITLPMLRPTVLFLSVMGVIWNLQLFDAVFILTHGGPANASVSVVYYIYRGAFHFDQLGHSATMSVLLFLLVMSLTVLQMRYGRQHGEAS
ncbi:carbohydrate ABC transporter permease [Candidatus Latescibacterota bacterium]